MTHLYSDFEDSSKLPLDTHSKILTEDQELGDDVDEYLSSSDQQSGEKETSNQSYISDDSDNIKTMGDTEEAIQAFRGSVELQTQSSNRSLEATEKQTQLLRSADERNELYRRVGVFKGGPEEDWFQFINKFGTFWDQQPDDSEEKRARNLAVLLGGEAAYSYRTLPDTVKGNYRELIKALEAHFTSPRYQLKQKALLAKRKQKPGESPAKFASVLRTIFRNAHKNNQAYLDLEDSLLKDTFIFGLREEHRDRIERRCRIPKTLVEAIKQAEDDEMGMMEIEGLLGKQQFLQPADKADEMAVGTTRAAPEKSQGELSTRVNQVDLQGPSCSSWQDSNNQNSVENDWRRRCWQCGRPGHLVADCWDLPLNPSDKRYEFDNRKCFQCGEIGHIAAYCYSEPDDEDAQYYQDEGAQGCEEDEENYAEEEDDFDTCGAQGGTNYQNQHPSQNWDDADGEWNNGEELQYSGRQWNLAPTVNYYISSPPEHPHVRSLE